MNTPVVSPVTSRTSKGTAYLEIVPQQDGRVRIQRTETGKTLNKFWTIWLRRLILTSTCPKDGFAVELKGAEVLVSASLSRQAIVSTVSALAEHIVPIPNPPIYRRVDAIRSRQAIWDVDPSVDLSEALNGIRLPHPAVLKLQNGLLTLDRGAKNPFTIGELCLIVEEHVARNCRP